MVMWHFTVIDRQGHRYAEDFQRHTAFGSEVRLTSDFTQFDTMMEYFNTALQTTEGRKFNSVIIKRID